MFTSVCRYTEVPEYLGDPYTEFKGILQFSNEEISAGIITSLLVVFPTTIITLLFRKSAKGNTEASKKSSRIDKVVKEAAKKGEIILPEKTYSRGLQPGEVDKNGVRKSNDWSGKYYYLAWLLTIAAIGKIIFLLLFLISHSL